MKKRIPSIPYSSSEGTQRAASSSSSPEIGSPLPPASDTVKELSASPPVMGPDGKGACALIILSASLAFSPSCAQIKSDQTLSWCAKNTSFDDEGKRNAHRHKQEKEDRIGDMVG